MYEYVLTSPREQIFHTYFKNDFKKSDIILEGCKV
jgi:hypothetical protein